MTGERNGWSHIEHWLKIQKYRQTDLAQRLGVTASAVTQIKKGIILLSARQMELIMDVLNASERERCEYWNTIFNARFCADGRNKNHYRVQLHDLLVDDSSSQWRSVPVIGFDVLERFDDKLESLEEFASKISTRRTLCSGESPCRTGVELDNDLPEGRILLIVDCAREVAHGDVALCKLRNGGEIILRRVLKEQGELVFYPLPVFWNVLGGSKMAVHQQVVWVLPVEEVRWGVNS